MHTNVLIRAFMKERPIASQLSDFVGFIKLFGRRILFTLGPVCLHRGGRALPSGILLGFSLPSCLTSMTDIVLV